MPTLIAKQATGRGDLDAALLNALPPTILHLGVDASGGAANVTGLTGVTAGDTLAQALNLTDLTDDSAKFATVANGTGSISQLNTNLSAKKILFFFRKSF